MVFWKQSNEGACECWQRCFPKEVKHMKFIWDAGISGEIVYKLQMELHLVS